MGLNPMPVVTFVGSALRSNVYKGFTDFVWLAENWPDSKVQFVAIGAEKDGHLGRIRLVRATTDQEKVACYLAISDVLVVPSRHEVFPLVVLEALSSGVPIVAYDVGGIREAIEGLPACHLVPPLNRRCLVKLLGESLGEYIPNRAEISAKLRNEALEKYSVQAMTRSYWRLYQEVMSRGCAG